MAGKRWTDKQIAVAKELLGVGMTYAEAAMELHESGVRPKCTLASLRLMAANHGLRKELEEKGTDPRAKTRHVRRVRGANGEISITTRSLDIRTEEAALEESGIDLERDKREIVWSDVNYFETTLGAKKSGTGRPETVTNCQVKVRTRPIVPDLQTLVLEGLCERLESKKIKDIPKFKRVDAGAQSLLVVGLFDHHFGKMAWKPEVGVNFDLKIASKLYAFGTQTILHKARPFGIEEIIFVIGNDFFHIDNRAGTTERGTPLDSDGRLPKIFRTGLESVVDAVLVAAREAPVRVVWVPGNHDPHTSYFLSMVLWAWFKGTKLEDRVTVDVSPDPRKFLAHGKCLIGLDHGNDVKPTEYPRLMAEGARELWAEAETCEWLLGHIHHRKTLSFISTNSFGSTTVRWLPSLAGSDFWHHQKGFTGSPQTAEGYIYHRDNGYDGHVVARATREQLASVGA